MVCLCIFVYFDNFFLQFFNITISIGLLIIILLSKTEMVTSNKHAIYKVGIIATKTQELRNVKVEEISTQESFLVECAGIPI